MTNIKKCFNSMWILLLVCVFGLCRCQEFCTTPFNVEGECISVQSCQVMKDLLKTLPKPIPDKYSVPLRRYLLCNQEEKYSVCCPKEGPMLPFLDATPPLPDVLKHPNLHLLPIKRCGVYNPDIGDDKIIRGENAALNEFPWMALLSYYDTSYKGPTFNCGGTIINDRYILTAAHCLTGARANLIGVRTGEYHIANKTDCTLNYFNRTICAPPVQDMLIEKIIVHPNYDANTLANDIGLLRLHAKINFTDNVQPICLPVEKKAQEFKSNYLFVTGWGYTDNYRTTSLVLQKASLPLVNREDCEAGYKGEVKISYKQLCAGAKTGKGSCQGDSGGPLQNLLHLDAVEDLAYVQQGVVSYGPRECGNVRIPEVYTRVSYYVDWILDKLKA